MVLPRLIKRFISNENKELLEASGIHPLLSSLWAARGISDLKEISSNLSLLIPPNKLAHVAQAARILCNAIENHKHILVFADYDCDGATSCAVAIRALSAMGAEVSYFVPNRFEMGYGLSSDAIKKIAEKKSKKPEIILTVDNGISSFEGVSIANSLGIKVIITDHHLPSANNLPEASAIVNPNQKICKFPSKNLSGVGVIFYLMIAIRAEMRHRGKYKPFGGPKLSKLLDLVALGTVADLVKLDQNNRLLVENGLQNIRNGLLQPGLRALFSISKRDLKDATVSDLSFCLAPRINAAGRLKDMHIGIACLLTNNYQEAMNMAFELDSINKQRRMLEIKMRKQASEAVQHINLNNRHTICLYNAKWHQGIVGLIASHLKEKFWKPAVVFASTNSDNMSGSGRSIPGIHLKQVLDLIHKSHNGLIDKFGGHAMAIGLTIRKKNYENFSEIFENTVNEFLKTTSSERIITTDGSLDIEYISVEIAQLLSKQVWGIGFNEPLFHDSFFILYQKIIQGKHLKLRLERNGKSFDAIWFSREISFFKKKIQAVYSIEKIFWKKKFSVYLRIEYAE